MNIIEMERKAGDFGFDAKDESDNIIHIDGSIDNGGNNYGFRPMQLLLSGLGGCSAIDIISILKKQKQKIDNLKIKVTGEREFNTTPSLWKTAEVFFEIYGEVDEEKARKATALSMDKHCSVAETLRRSGTTITWHVKVIKNENALST